jgi:Protein of unknown function (DUF2867)
MAVRMLMEHLPQYDELKPFLSGADYTDIKTFDGKTSLRNFIAGMLSYYPWWLIFLYKVREMIVEILGLAKHEAPYEIPSFKPDDIPFSPAHNASFFIVRAAKENEFWFAETPEDKHLVAYVGVVVEKLEADLNRFYVITTVKYKHWTGPVYFNIIRPFHHLVVYRMGKAGLKIY